MTLEEDIVFIKKLLHAWKDQRMCGHYKRSQHLKKMVEAKLLPQDMLIDYEAIWTEPRTR